MAGQQLLPSIEPSANDLYEQAIAQPLDKKIKQAIGLMQMHEPPEGYYLAYSGGKDSGAILELARMAGVKFEPWYNVTTLDPPELVRFIKREHPEVQWNRPEMALLTMMWKHPGCQGPPTMRNRWCCKEYKEHGGDGRFKIIGVRGPESPKRKKRWKQVLLNRNGGRILCPILYWTENDIWQFHASRNLAYCELYDEGLSRLGCIGCPFAGPKGQTRHFNRWPKYEEMWQKAFKRFWNKWHGVPKHNGDPRWFEDFGNWEGVWKWWRTLGSSKSMDKGCQGLGLYN